MKYIRIFWTHFVLLVVLITFCAMAVYLSMQTTFLQSEQKLDIVTLNEPKIVVRSGVLTTSVISPQEFLQVTDVVLVYLADGKSFITFTDKNNNRTTVRGNCEIQNVDDYKILNQKADSNNIAQKGSK